MSSKRGFRREFGWVNLMKKEEIKQIRRELHRFDDEDRCDERLQERLRSLIADTLNRFTHEIGNMKEGFKCIGLSLKALKDIHPVLRFNGFNILRALYHYMSRYKMAVWEARAVIRIWIEICCNNNGYPYPRRAQQKFEGQIEFLTYTLPNFNCLHGTVPSLAMQKQFCKAIHDSLLPFTEKRRYELGYSCACHLGGSSDHSFWHAHLKVSMTRLLVEDKPIWKEMRDGSPIEDDLWPFLRGEPLYLTGDNFRMLRESWNCSLQRILQRSIKPKKDLVIKRDRKKSYAQVERDDTKVAFYTSAVSRDPFRFTFKLSKDKQTIMLVPREYVKWRSKPKGNIPIPLEVFVRGRLLSPLAKCMRRASSGYMHSNATYNSLILKAQEFGMLRMTPDEIARHGKAAAKEKGWI